tara:strand:- start:1855 stop:2361 length:507 start_codon:yes stop_codon:yes gene_type:complete
MKNYQTKILKAIKNNYKKSTIFDRNFINEYYKFRIDKKKQILNKRKKIKIISASDHTYYYFKNTKKNAVNSKKIFIFYKKFEVNQSLKKNYDKNFNKLSNIATYSETYIFLGLMLIKNERLNLLQKLNCILKILDNLLINNKNTFIHKNEILELIDWEIKQIKNLSND